MSYKRIKNLFLRQSYLDSWEDYERSLRKESYIKWDYIILTASNEEQAVTYREQIQYRLDNQLLPMQTKYAVLPDPDGKRVGSGGATFNVLKYIAEQEQQSENYFANKRILVIHSGGDSKRVPQYSASGKLFSPVPRKLPNGRGSTLFDEFIIGMTSVPSRIKEGMLILSGDVLLLFNSLQIDFSYRGAAAISIKEHVETGKNHGVFLNDGNDFVGNFLHKQSEEKLREMGAVNEQGYVDLDTGAVIMDPELLNSLFSLISTDYRLDETKFNEFVNEESRISFYGDFLYPLAKNSTLEQYYKEEAEGIINDKLLKCREKIWNILSQFSMKLLCLSPAEFIHFGTTRELLQLVTDEVSSYEFLGWDNKVLTTIEDGEESAAYNAYVGKRVAAGAGSYIENSYVLGNSVVGESSILSNVKIVDTKIPSDIVMHGLQLLDGRYVVRVYGVQDNPKMTYEKNASFLTTTLPEFIQKNGLKKSDIWKNSEEYLWFADLYPVCDTMKEAVEMGLLLCRMAEGSADTSEIQRWIKAERQSMYSSFNKADAIKSSVWQRELENRILSNQFIHALQTGEYYKEALEVFGTRGITEDIFKVLMEDAGNADFSLKIRMYYAISRFMKEQKKTFGIDTYDWVERLCFEVIQKTIYEEAAKNIKTDRQYKIAKEHVNIELPVRVNWGGGWTDTPPYCNEKGGAVLNAAIKLNGIFPVQIEVHKVKEYHIEFESKDIGVKGIATTVEEIRNCHNPYDSFALHKAALIASGIIPLEGKETLQEILEKIGGGIYLSTQVIGIPKGSGLGTSSILAGACIKGLFEFLGQNMSDAEIYDVVLGMEQIMSTGGGWQDQVGGLAEGVKLILSKPGIHQNLEVQKVELSEDTKKELQERFALIYTGQRRLARNLLREVVGNYIGGRPESVDALEKMEPLAAAMRFSLERGRIDQFAQLLNEHWELSKQLDGGSTNTCIDQIFMACEEMIDGKFISGAGGGGFLQVIMKKGITHDMLKARLKAILG